MSWGEGNEVLVFIHTKKMRHKNLWFLKNVSSLKFKRNRIKICTSRQRFISYFHEIFELEDSVSFTSTHVILWCTTSASASLWHFFIPSTRGFISIFPPNFLASQNTSQKDDVFWSRWTRWSTRIYVSLKKEYWTKFLYWFMSTRHDYLLWICKKKKKSCQYQ